MKKQVTALHQWRMYLDHSSCALLVSVLDLIRYVKAQKTVEELTLDKGDLTNASLSILVGLTLRRFQLVLHIFKFILGLFNLKIIRKY